MGQTDSCYPLACTSKATVNLPFVANARRERGLGEEGGNFSISFSERNLLCVRVVDVDDYLMKLAC